MFEIFNIIFFLLNCSSCRSFYGLPLERTFVSLILVMLSCSDFLLFGVSLSISVFVSRCSVLYFSVHRYEEGSFWPHLPEGDSSAVGSGPGEGYSINVPWNKVKHRRSSCVNHTHPARVELILISLSVLSSLCVLVFSLGWRMEITSRLSREFCCL